MIPFTAIIDIFNIIIAMDMVILSGRLNKMCRLTKE